MTNIQLLFHLLIFPIILVAQPEITIEKPLFNYGTIPYGSKGECEFIYKNTGNKPLIVSHAQTSGGGLAWVSQKFDTVPPGGYGKIRFKYDTQRVGSIHKTGVIHSNSVNGSVEITVKGFVKAIPIAFPEYKLHDFGTINPGKKMLTWEFNLTNCGAALLIVSKIERPDDCDVSLSNDNIGQGETAQVSVSIAPKNHTGSLERKVKVYTNAAPAPIEFTLKADIEYSPLKIGTVAPYSQGSFFFSVEYENTSADTLEIYFAEGDVVKNADLVNAQARILMNGEELHWSKEFHQVLPYEKGWVGFRYESHLMYAVPEHEIILSSRVKSKKKKFRNTVYVAF